MSAPLRAAGGPAGAGTTGSTDADPLALARVLAAGNPAHYAGALRLPALRPPRLPRVKRRRTGRASSCLRLSGTLPAAPRKFAAQSPHQRHQATADGFLEKDRAENIMIVDLVRNDLSMVAATGSVAVPEFLATEAHPGLFHLVSGVSALLAEGAGWSEIFDATFPPGSVTGHPSRRRCGSSATSSRCRADPIAAPSGGWMPTPARPSWRSRSGPSDRTRRPLGDADPPDDAMVLKFGTGAGITWGSDPEAEWRETG